VGGDEGFTPRRNRRITAADLRSSGDKFLQPGGGSERGKESERRGDRGDLIEKVLMAIECAE
jgi:hypothetical protein